jgi:NAD(P)-dependent dehydrogenase (short-subunit alcohol dehydrogenase family)
MELTGKVALVTGAAHRVGRALALALAREGADIALHYHRSAEAARETAREIVGCGRRVALLAADLGQVAETEALAARAVAELGRLDVLINSASLFESSALLDVDAAAWDRVMAVNLRAPFLLTRAAASYLTEAGGVIINIADLSGIRVWQAFPHHGVSKAGLIHLTRVAARSLGPRVRVNCVVPGTVLPPDDYTEEQVAASVERTVLKRVGSPRDVEEAMLFLIRSDFATGSVVVVDGGRMLR